jgi:hypothetical protein
MMTPMTSPVNKPVAMPVSVWGPLGMTGFSYRVVHYFPINFFNRPFIACKDAATVAIEPKIIAHPINTISPPNGTYMSTMRSPCASAII